MCLRNVVRITNKREKSGYGYKICKPPLEMHLGQEYYSGNRCSGLYHDTTYDVGVLYEAESLSPAGSARMHLSEHYNKGFHIYRTLRDAQTAFMIMKQSMIVMRPELWCMKVKYEDAQYEGFDNTRDDTVYIQCVVANKITFLERVEPFDAQLAIE